MRWAIFQLFSASNAELIFNRSSTSSSQNRITNFRYSGSAGRGKAIVRELEQVEGFDLSNNSRY
jgi:hypothetical protein